MNSKNNVLLGLERPKWHLQLPRHYHHQIVIENLQQTR